jgi:hypothetical protein
MARLTNRNPTPYRLTIGDRGAMRLPPQAAGMTYHHIIPFNELRDFWNTAVRNDLEQLRETLVPALLRAMDAYPLDQGNPARARALLDSARRMLQMIWMGNYVHSATANSPDGIEDFKAVYTWMPGNLFPGPTRRSNDPEDLFDSFANRVVEGDRYLTVLRAHQAIQAYLGQPGLGVYTADAAGTRARTRAGQMAHAAGLALARVAAYPDVAAYDPSRW